MVNGVLVEAFRHNSWATKQLLASCRGLSQEQLSSAATGSYGNILATFNHIVGADERNLLRLTGGEPAWAIDREESSGLDQLEAQVDETERLWERFLDQPVDAEREIIVDEGALGVRAGVIVAQALHHGNAHREQICAILTGFGIEPPDVQAWAYAEATGRMWERTKTI